MSPPSVLNMFKTNIDHQNIFGDNFGKIEFLVDFEIFYLWVSVKKPRKTAKNRDKPPKTTKICFFVFGPPPKNLCIDNSL